MKSNKESLSDVGQAYISLHQDTCSFIIIAFLKQLMRWAMCHGHHALTSYATH